MTADPLTTRIAVAIHGATPPDPDAALALHRAQAERVVAALGAGEASDWCGCRAYTSPHPHNPWRRIYEGAPCPEIRVDPLAAPTMSRADCRCPDDCDCDGRFACEVQAGDTTRRCELVVGHDGWHEAGNHRWTP